VVDGPSRRDFDTAGLVAGYPAALGPRAPDGADHEGNDSEVAFVLKAFVSHDGRCRTVATVFAS